MSISPASLPLPVSPWEYFPPICQKVSKLKKRRRTISILCTICVALWNLSVDHPVSTCGTSIRECHADEIELGKPVTTAEFFTPPDVAKPWVYWVIMDGNLTREGVTADFEAMRDQGVGGFIMMEVNNGVPRGSVDFMSETWQELFVHIVREAERCGLQMCFF